MKVVFALPGVLLSFGLLAASLPAGYVVGWGNNPTRGCDAVPFSHSYSNVGTVTIAGNLLTNAVAISGGSIHALALTTDGRVVGWGDDTAGQTTGAAPDDKRHPTNGPVIIGGQQLSDVAAISAGGIHNLALKRNGTVVAWGLQLRVETKMPSDLTNVVAIAAGSGHSIALRSDGTVLGWGRTKMPIGLSNVTAISASPAPIGLDTAVKCDGSVVQWSTQNGQVEAVPGLSNVVAAGGDESFGAWYVALKRDGTVVRWQEGRPPLLVSDLSNVVAVAGSETHAIALKSDGTVAGIWGVLGLANIPEGLSNVVAIAAGGGFSLAITTNKAVADRFR